MRRHVHVCVFVCAHVCMFVCVHAVREAQASETQCL